MFNVTVHFSPPKQISPLKLEDWQLVQKKLNNETLSKETLKKFVVLEPIRDIYDKIKPFTEIYVTTLSGSNLHYSSNPRYYFESFLDYDENSFNLGKYTIPIDQIFLITLTTDTTKSAILINKNMVDYIEST